jgi:predicted nuclease of predicted toxin-antitoxin system
MRFLVDENIGPAIARWLRSDGHDVFSVYESARGSSDEDIITLAYRENRILITSDKDFGEKIFREQYPHHGVILLRLHDERNAVKRKTLDHLIEGYSDRLADRFVVVSEKRVRFARR